MQSTPPFRLRRPKARSLLAAAIAWIGLGLAFGVPGPLIVIGLAAVGMVLAVAGSHGSSGGSTDGDSSGSDADASGDSEPGDGSGDGGE